MHSELQNILNRKPAKLILFGQEYKVVFDNSLLLKREDGTPKSLAEARPVLHKIVFAEDITDEWIMPVLIHEILEIINYHFEMGMTHQNITILETSLFAILKDNNLIK